MTVQLELFPDIKIRPTIAMHRGDSHIAQCRWCGTLVCAPSTANKTLGACPSCERDLGWIQQHYAGPFHRAEECDHDDCMHCIECEADLDNEDHLEGCPESDLDPRYRAVDVPTGSYL